MDRQKKPPAAAPLVRKRKKAGSDSGGAGAAASAGPSTSPPAAKKARVAGPKAKAARADKAQEEADAGAREDARGDAADEERVGKVHTGVFSKDLPWLMYGFGDADKPLKETVDLVEEIAMQYITDTVHTAMRAAATRTAAGASSASRKDELKVEDVLYAVRRDPRKVTRIQDLIRRQEEILNAKKVLQKMDGDEDMPAEI